MTPMRLHPARNRLHIARNSALKMEETAMFHFGVLSKVAAGIRKRFFVGDLQNTMLTFRFWNDSCSDVTSLVCKNRMVPQAVLQLLIQNTQAASLHFGLT